MSYKFREDVAIADVAFEAISKTLEGLFESAGEALMNTQVKDLSKIEPNRERSFEIKAENEERLLHDFLQELIFLKDAELLLVRKYDLKITKTNETYTLTAKVTGEKINMKMHELLVDVKAVSWHMFKVERTQKGWNAFVILDV